MQTAPVPRSTFFALRDRVQPKVQGFLVAAVIAAAAQFLSDHYRAPAMLMALLLGVAFHFLAEEGPCKPGIEFTARSVLRFGVLTGGSVAICGASAAMAISAVLPKNEHSERNLIFTVLSFTVLSTAAMIVYPILSETLDFSDEVAGVFLGGTIHDVAQVVGAGFSVSDQTGEVATLVKLIRVAMLAPVVLVISILVRRHAGAADTGQRPPLLPVFVVGFLILAVLNSLGLVPAPVTQAMSDLSRWALLVSIAAVGMKTSLKRILDVGGQAIAMIVAETVFIAALVIGGVLLLGH